MIIIVVAIGPRARAELRERGPRAVPEDGGLPRRGVNLLI